MEAIIYLITNIANNKKYVGFTTLTIKQRWNKHCRDAKYGRPTFLCNAIRKYGVDSFIIEPLEVCTDIIYARDLLENKFIQKLDTLNSGYNMTVGGEGTLGHKHSTETKHNMSILRTGKKHTESTKILLSKIKSGKNNPNYGKKFDLEYRLKISKGSSGAKNGRAKKYLVSLPTGEEIIVDDRSGFCKKHRLNYSCVCRSIKFNKKYRGYYFKEI